MKLNFNERQARLVNRILLPATVALVMTTAMRPWLASAPTEHPRIDTPPFYALYRMGALFGLPAGTAMSGPGMTKVTREVFTPAVHRLQAVYIDKSHAFVAVSDGSSTAFIDRGEHYKGIYRLIGVTPVKAVFSAYGRLMPLQLGRDGNLSRKETVTQYLPGDNETPATRQNYTIPRATVERYSDNMADLWKNMTINEVTFDGKITGFRVDALAPGTLFSLLGVRQGDILTAVDNKPLDSYAAAFSAYRTALERPAIKISVIRNNQPKDLEYEISR